jgi:radical SAM superfamily enzyme YgiQ (UPF0313 family)
MMQPSRVRRTIMEVKLISPPMTVGQTRGLRQVRYSLFPPLGLATLAGYLRDDDEVTLTDENVERLHLDDAPDVVAIQVNVTSARRAYAIGDHYRGRGAHVVMGGLHATAMPEEALQHADTVCVGPGEGAWPAFLEDFRAGRPGRIYRATGHTLAGVPPVRRDLIVRRHYVAANSLVVSRGCPHACRFCTNSTFFRGGRHHYHQALDQALAEIARLPGRHLYFLDDHFFGDREFARALMRELKAMGKVWQAAGTVETARDRALMMEAAEAGMRTLLVGFETLSEGNLRAHGKRQNLGDAYHEAVRNLHDAGLMINATFVFGMDADDESVFDRAVEWAIAEGIETATFHILTPYPGTALFDEMRAAGRILTEDWDLYDTRHVVFRPARMTPAQLLAGYRRAYRRFYEWSSLRRSAAVKRTAAERLRHIAYAAGWGKFPVLWDALIRAGQTNRTVPLLMAALTPRPPLHSWRGGVVQRAAR